MWAGVSRTVREFNIVWRVVTLEKPSNIKMLRIDVTNGRHIKWVG